MNMKENNIDFLKSIVITKDSSPMLRFVFDKVIENVPDNMLNLSTKEFLVYMYKETRITDAEFTEGSNFSSKILKTENDITTFAEKFKNDILELLDMRDFISEHNISVQALYSEVLSDQKDFRKKLVLYALNSTINEIKYGIADFFGPSLHRVNHIWSDEIQSN